MTIINFSGFINFRITFRFISIFFFFEKDLCQSGLDFNDFLVTFFSLSFLIPPHFFNSIQSRFTKSLNLLNSIIFQFLSFSFNLSLFIQFLDLLFFSINLIYNTFFFFFGILNFFCYFCFNFLRFQFFFLYRQLFIFHFFLNGLQGHLRCLVNFTF